MKDCCGQEIVPNRKKLSIHKNRHPNTDGSSWGWIEGCTSNICWSNNSAFNYEKASEFVKQWNEKAEREGVNVMEHPVEPDSLRSRVTGRYTDARQAPTEGIMELAKQMWEMKLNDEIMMPDGSWFVTRVPGGWIYRHNAGEIAVFVPLDNEFVRTAGAQNNDFNSTRLAPRKLSQCSADAEKENI